VDAAVFADAGALFGRPEDLLWRGDSQGVVGLLAGKQP